MARHVRTDPACRLYRPPVTRFARWRYERRRGVPCPVCAMANWPKPNLPDPGWP